MQDIYWMGLIAMAIVMIVLTHTIQVWIWALAFVLMSALPDINDAVYFALVTYTTLGYGDITIADELRTFCSMAAVTGLLSFGLSAAFLVEILTRFMPKKL
ncbi:MAG: two pore domain potassium channel family protein [Hyphomicrobiales bacterium]|nr:two pore domain potassium channel family protein [Hyphomicrobiales bacterium]